MFIIDSSLCRKDAYVAYLVRWMPQHGELFGMLGVVHLCMDPVVPPRSMRAHVCDRSTLQRLCLMRLSFASTKSCREFVGGLCQSQHADNRPFMALLIPGTRHRLCVDEWFLHPSLDIANLNEVSRSVTLNWDKVRIFQ